MSNTIKILKQRTQRNFPGILVQSPNPFQENRMFFARIMEETFGISTAKSQIHHPWTTCKLSPSWNLQGSRKNYYENFRKKSLNSESELSWIQFTCRFRKKTFCATSFGRPAYQEVTIELLSAKYWAKKVFFSNFTRNFMNFSELDRVVL